MLHPLASRPDALQPLLVGSRTPQAAEQHLQALREVGADESGQSTYARILKDSHPNNDVYHLQALAAMRGKPQMLGTYRKLVGRISAEAASQDVALIQAQSERHGRSLEEVGNLVVALRYHDPLRRRYGPLPNLRPVLDHVLAGGSEEERRARTDQVISWQIGYRDASQAWRQMDRVQRLTLPDADRAAFEQTHRRLLKTCSREHDADLLRVLDSLDGRDNALPEMRAFHTLLRACHRRPQQAVSDLTAAIEHVEKHHGDLAGMLAGLARERGADGARESHSRPFADVQVVLERAAAPLAPRDHAVDRLRVCGRNVEQALRCYERLAAIAVDDEQRELLVEEFRKLIKPYATSHDEHFHRALDVVRGQPQPLQALQHFGRLLEAGLHPQAAADDLRLALQTARPDLPVEEVLDYLEAMRKNDPMRESSVRTLADVEPVLQYVAKPAQPEQRRERADAVASWQVGYRNIGQAFQLAVFISEQPQGEAMVEILAPALRKIYPNDEDSVMLALRTAAGAERPLEAVRTFASLAVKYRPARALADTELILDAAGRHQMPVDDVAVTVAALRRADPGRHGTSRPWADIRGGLDLILSAADPTTRGERTRSMARLLAADGLGGAAGNALGWILAEPVAGNELAAATRGFVALRDRTRNDVDRDSLHALYDVISQAGRGERQGWLQRLLRRPKKLENVARKLLLENTNPALTLQYLEAIQTGRLPGESLRSSYRRFRKLLRVQRNSRREVLGSTNDAASLCRAFVGVLAPFASGDPTPREKWNRFLPILRATRSAAHADTVYRSMTLATSPSECAARATAFESFRQMASGDRVGASFLYDGACSSLGAADSIGLARQALADRLRTAPPATAAMQYKVEMEFRDQPRSLRQSLHETLGRAGTAAEAAEIYRRLRTPVTGESVAEPAGMVSGCLAGWARVADGLASYDRVVADLGTHPDFVAAAAPYGHLRFLVSRLPQVDKEQDVSEHLLRWLQEPPVREALGSPPLADALVALGARLILGKDVASVKANLLASAADIGADGIIVGAREVHLNGIRVPMR